MNKKMIYILNGIVAVLCLCSCSGEDLNETKATKEPEPATQISEFVRTADDIPIEMLRADYWINMQKNPDKIVMTEKEIFQWNEKFHKPFWNDLSENIGYGYTVERTDIRRLPSDDFAPIEESEYFDDLQVSSILLNEPVVVTEESDDGQWYYITCKYCSGWVRKSSVAFCQDFDSWIEKMNSEDFLLVTGDKEILEVDTEHIYSSELVLYMGTKLELVKYEDYEAVGGERLPFESYIVKVPVREDDGMLGYEYGFVPVSRDVCEGYLPFTMNNLITQMFKVNGDRYGWGGMYNARDCSQYVMEIYSLFGFEFARNSSAQASMPLEEIDMKNMSVDEKEKVLKKLQTGSILYFTGHVMLYLGNVDGEYYVISETAALETTAGEEGVVNAHSCMVTSLDSKRANGMTWLEEISMVKVIK